MSVYFIVFFLTVLLQVIKINTERDYLVRCILSFVPLFIYGALRVDYGLDYPSYKWLFDTVHNETIFDPSEYREEIGYLLINRILPSFRWVLILSTLLTCISYIWVMYKYIPSNFSWFFVIFLFVTGNFTFVFSFVGIRNGIVVAMLLLSSELIRQRKIWKFALVTALASTIHTSSLLYFPLAYFIGRGTPMSLKETRVWMIVLAILLVIPINRIAIRLLPFIGNYFDLYSTYFRTYASGDASMSLLIKCVSLIAVALILWYMRKKPLDDCANMMGRLSLLFFEAQLLGGIAGRLPQNYIIFVSVMLIDYIQKVKDEIRLYGLSGLIAAYYAYSFFIVWMRSPYFAMQTYHSVLNP